MTDDEDALLAASREAYKARAKSSRSEQLSEEAFLDGADVIHLEDDEHGTQRHDLKSAKPSKQLSAKKRGKRREEPEKDVSESALHALEVNPTTTSRKPSKREIEEFHSMSAGPKWFGMPAFGGASYKSSSRKAQTEGGKSSFTGGDARGATERELRQQIQAIRLRNALDPKRFYRGSSGTGAERGMPPFAQLGRIVGGGLEPSSVLTRSQRSDSVVGELVRDSQSISYSKRKFDEKLSYKQKNSHEITEHHLQAALSSNQVEATGGPGVSKKSYHIPTPKSVEVLSQAQYNKEYPTGAYSDPVTYVRFSDTVETTTQGPSYCMDDDDKGWLDKHNEKAREEAQRVEKDSKNSEQAQYKVLVKKDAAKYTIISEDEFETVMFVFERATCERHPLLELDMSKMPTLDELLHEFDEKSATSALALPELPATDVSITQLVNGTSNKTTNAKNSAHATNADKGKAQERQLQWSVKNPFRHLFLLKSCACAIYPWWKLRREAREGKQIVPQLNFDESNENDPYVCFRRREVKSARKTRKTDTLQLEKLVRLESEMRQATSLLLMVAQRERLKEQQVTRARSCWAQAQELIALKRKWAILGPNKGQEDENLIFSVQPDPTAPVAVNAAAQSAQLKKKRKADEASAPTTLKIRRPKTGDSDQAVNKTGAEAVSSTSNSAILDRIQAVQTFIERECTARQQADAGMEDLTDSAFQPVSAPPSIRAFRPIQSDNNDTHFWSNHPFARLGRQSCFRRRMGRGGRIFLDRRPVVASPAPANIGAWPRQHQNGFPLATFGYGRLSEQNVRRSDGAGRPMASVDALRSYAPFVYSTRVAPMLLPTPDLSWDPLTSKDPREPLSHDPTFHFGRLDERSGAFNVTQNSDGDSTSSESTDRTRSSEESGDGQSTQATDIDQDAMQEDKLQPETESEAKPEESVEEQMERAQKLAERWRYDEDGGRWAGMGLVGLGGMEGDEEAVLDDFDQRFIRYRMSLLDESNLLKLSTDWTYMRQALMAAAAPNTPALSTVSAPVTESNGTKSDREGTVAPKSKNSTAAVPAKADSPNQTKEAK
ncbi:Enhancer of polycomb-like protein 1 [Malassezia caprae]|uniref:Enhancer of polycomb-like protein n=1 Tax=Malassezia caprae TaxID=1381934 RepID=A0AAF0IZG9_9BASI|nr:Enhancer of polycomb-like protein 1 [Malassezia caprae]